MENLYVILILVIILLAIFIENNKENKDNKENLDSTQSSLNLSNEAIQNIASVYNNQNMAVTNLNTTGNLSVKGDINFAQFKGIIVAWSGAIADIPKGWGICDGTKYKALDGTDLQSPDLRSKFILGAGKGKDANGVDLTDRKVGEKGGSENHTLSVNEMPSHNHDVNVRLGGDWNPSDSFWGINAGRTFNHRSATTWGPTLVPTSYFGGTPTRTEPDRPAASASITSPHNNMPPFFILAYIIKL
jgi:microcystin-dependent protein